MIEASPSTDPPGGDIEPIPEKINDAKEGGPAFHCDLCDVELLYKITQALLPGLATSCVDNTTGGVFRSPGSVAADIRKEMVEYLTQRSETFVAESVVLDGGPEAEASEHPYDIIAYLIDEFAISKRNLFSRVSALLLSDRREDKIDDFAQQMEMNGFWSIDKREAIVQTLLKNVDFKNEFHCDMKFDSADELALHMPTCSYRSMNCESEGCDARFSANQREKHDSVCPFKIIPCEQKCSDSIMRREMDRHCVTVCPMKLVNCPFYSVGCKSAIPQCKIEEHLSESLHSHIQYILQGIHKEASVTVLRERVEQLERASSGKLANIRNVRSLTSKVKNLDAQLGPLVYKTDEEASETATELESLEVSCTNVDTEKAAGTEGVKNSEAEPPLEVSQTSKDSEENKTEIKDSEAKLRSLEIAPLNKDSKEASKTVVEDAEAKLPSLGVAPLNKDSEEAAETEIRDSEPKLPSLEIAPLNEGSEEAAETEIKDSEPNLPSLEVAPLNKVSKEASESVVEDAEAKQQSLEDATTKKDIDEAPERTANHSEASPPLLEVTPTNQISEATTENPIKFLEEASPTNKTSEDGKRDFKP